MDINLIAKLATVSPTPEVPQGKLGVQQIVPVEQLNLIPNRPYSAQAFSPVGEFLAAAQSTSQTNPQNQAGVQAYQSAQEPQTSSSPSQANSLSTRGNNWLILLQGKLINVLSELPLTKGERLNVSLQSNALHVSSLSNHKGSASLAPGSLSPQQVDTLIREMSSLVSNQVPLAKGLNVLNQLAQGTAVSNANDPVPPATSREASVVLSSLLKALPQKQQLVPVVNPESTNTLQAATPLSPAPSPQTIKQILEKSGVALESSLLTNKTSTALLASQVSSLVATMTTGAEGPSSEAAGVLAQTKRTLTSAIQSLLSQQANQSVGSQSSAVQPTSPNTAAMQGSNSAIPKPQTEAPSVDLKTLLVAAVSALSQKVPASSTHEGLNDPELLKMPFNFPSPVSSQVLKAESILADQELTTGQLLKLMAGMLNRIQFNQLNSLYQSQTALADPAVNQQSWFLELPVVSNQQNVEVFSVRIDKEERESTEEDGEGKKQEVQWRVALSFNFEEMGDIYIQTNITPPSISSTIWANQSSTLALINKEQAHFRQRLAGLGLEVGDIVCQFGQPALNKAKLDRNLVDINA